jgi:hypothetical protein
MRLSTAENNHPQPGTPEHDPVRHEQGPSPLEPAEPLDALQAENTRLQALVCYLVHINQELRQQNGGDPLQAGARDSKAERI